MRSSFSTIIVLVIGLVALVAAWSKEDHEIFRLRDEVVTAEGNNVTFYSFLGVSSSASLDDVNKAYRKRSRQLHPDKAIQQIIAQRSAPKASDKSSQKKPGVRVTKGPSQKERTQIAKEANERYARLAVVASILKGPQRERYNHFLQNGFPTWRGTGYYYARLRPGLGTVLFGLLISFGGGAHYFALYMNYKRQREFVERYITHARRTAWGNDGGVPGIPSAEVDNNTAAAPPAALDTDEQQMPMNRKQKRMQEKESRRKDTTKATRIARLYGKSEPASGASDTSTPVEQPVPPPPQQPLSSNKKRVVAENGKVLIVDQDGNVYLEEQTEEGEKHEYLLDVSPRHSLLRTMLIVQ